MRADKQQNVDDGQPDVALLCGVFLTALSPTGSSLCFSTYAVLQRIPVSTRNIQSVLSATQCVSQCEGCRQETVAKVTALRFVCHRKLNKVSEAEGCGCSAPQAPGRRSPAAEGRWASGLGQTGLCLWPMPTWACLRSTPPQVRSRPLNTCSPHPLN